jgi:hypothetical protein
MHISKYTSILAVVMTLGFSSVTHAQLNLANTGVDLSPANGFDDNYLFLGTTTSVGLLPISAGTNAVISSTAVFPISTGNWFADTTVSKWIRPGTTLADASASTNAANLFVFKTSFNFDASIFNLSTASIVIKTAADNELSVFLNSEPSALFGSGVINNLFADFSASFTLTQTTGLQAGLNSLYFYVTNIPNDSPANLMNPSGLRVELDPTVTLLPRAVPEPSTYAIIGSVGLLGLIALRSRRKR